MEITRGINFLENAFKIFQDFWYWLHYKTS